MGGVMETLTPNTRATYTIIREGELAAIISPPHRRSGLPRLLPYAPYAGLIFKHLRKGVFRFCVGVAWFCVGVASNAPHAEYACSYP